MKTALTILSLSLSTLTFAQDSISLSETYLKEQLKTNPPSIAQIEASYLGSEVQKQQIDDQFNTTLDGQVYYKKTKEKQLAAFMPITSPIKTYELGLNRNFKHGFSLGFKGTQEQTTNSFVTDRSVSTVGFSLGVDLYKNFLGRTVRNQLRVAELGSQSAGYDKTIQTKAFYNNLRKLYWALVANNESIKITKGLLKSSEDQVKQAKRRKKNRIADAGEVARYQSQVAARKANIISLQYQRSDLLQQLKQLLPEISDKEIELGSYSIDASVARVLACTEVISKRAHTPMDYTFYDEMIANLKTQESLESEVNDVYASADVGLQAEAMKVGKSFSLSDANSDLKDNGETAYSVALNISIPLEGKKRTTEEVLQMINKKKYSAQQKANLARVNAYHTQVVKSITLLKEVIRNQQLNTKYLAQSLKTSKRKYNQARLTVQQLVQEQDAFLQSNLDEIQTKLYVINTLLDYLSVFTETPCELNQ